MRNLSTCEIYLKNQKKKSPIKNFTVQLSCIDLLKQRKIDHTIYTIMNFFNIIKTTNLFVFLKIFQNETNPIK